MIEVVAEFLAVALLARHKDGLQQAVLPQQRAQAVDQVRILGEAFHQDIPRAIEGVLRALDPGLAVQERKGLCVGFELGRAEQPVGEGLQARLDGDLALRSPLGLVGEVQVFEEALAVRRENLPLELVGQLSLVTDAAQDHAAALFEFAQVAQARLQVPELHIVQASRHFLAVARDEGHGSPLVQKSDGGRDLGRANVELRGNRGENV